MYKGDKNMFKFEKKVVGEADIEKVWKYYENVKLWKEWDPSLKDVVLEGNFENGVKGIMFLANEQAPPLHFELAAVEKNKQFTGIAVLGDIEVTMEHYLSQQGKDVEIYHVVSVKGNNEQAVQGIGHGLTDHMPEYMDNLLAIGK